MSALFANTCGICTPGLCPHVEPAAHSVPTQIPSTLAEVERENVELRGQVARLTARLREVTRAARRTLSVARGEIKDHPQKRGPKPKGTPQ